MLKKEIIQKMNEMQKGRRLYNIFVRLVTKSSNPKTGSISQTYTSRISCPDGCIFNKTGLCYGKSYRIGKVADETELFGVTIYNFSDLLENNPHTRIIRHNIVGDLTSDSGTMIDEELLKILIEGYEREGVKAFTYTHTDINEHNIKLIKEAEKHNFIINYSCESMEQVKKAMENGVNACLTVNEMPKKAILKDGIVLRYCPNEAGEIDRFGEKMTCKECGMCWRKNRKFAVVFSAHGTVGNVNKMKKLCGLLNADDLLSK